MSKNSYTLIIVPNASSGLHKVHVPLWAFYSVCILGLAIFFSAVGMGFNYARMALQTSDYDQLVAENTDLKVENKNLEVSTRQLNTKIETLQDLTAQIQDMMQTDTWNQRLGLLDSVGLGGTLDDAPTSTVIASLNLRDSIGLTRDLALELEGQLRFVESLAERRNGTLEFTPSLWPVSGPVRSGYGRRRDPFTGETEIHQGLDIGALYGSAIRVPADGRVIYAARQPAYGNLIVVDHGNGITTRYGHLSNFETRVGDRLKKGDLIGYVGSTGRSTGPHLHYEVRLDDRTVNPRSYLPVNSSRTAD
jgi:murein DD-endopeptidase MepM/ murein hydrolase activator NlpD